MPEPSELLERQFRQAQLRLEASVREALAGLHDATVDPDDIDAAYAALIPQAATVIAAAQAAGVTLVNGYLGAVLAVNGAETRLSVLDGLVGSSRAGTLADGMGAWPVMVKAQIGSGATPADALGYGRYLTERFGSSETLRAVDEQEDFAAKESGRFKGWEGVVSAGACDPCSGNRGFHPISQPIYRHGSCRCSKRYVVA